MRDEGICPLQHVLVELPQRALRRAPSIVAGYRFAMNFG